MLCRCCTSALPSPWLRPDWTLLGPRDPGRPTSVETGLSGTTLVGEASSTTSGLRRRPQTCAGIHGLGRMKGEFALGYNLAFEICKYGHLHRCSI